MLAKKTSDILHKEETRANSLALYGIVDQHSNLSVWSKNG